MVLIICYNFNITYFPLLIIFHGSADFAVRDTKGKQLTGFRAPWSKQTWTTFNLCWLATVISALLAQHCSWLNWEWQGLTVVFCTRKREILLPHSDLILFSIFCFVIYLLYSVSEFSSLSSFVPFCFKGNACVSVFLLPAQSKKIWPVLQSI